MASNDLIKLFPKNKVYKYRSLKKNEKEHLDLEFLSELGITERWTLYSIEKDGGVALTFNLEIVTLASFSKLARKLVNAKLDSQVDFLIKDGKYNLRDYSYSKKEWDMFLARLPSEEANLFLYNKIESIENIYNEFNCINKISKEESYEVTLPLLKEISYKPSDKPPYILKEDTFGDIYLKHKIPYLDTEDFEFNLSNMIYKVYEDGQAKFYIHLEFISPYHIHDFKAY